MDKILIFFEKQFLLKKIEFFSSSIITTGILKENIKSSKKFIYI